MENRNREPSKPQTDVVLVAPRLVVAILFRERAVLKLRPL
jgi:hypothetical protein